MPDLTDILVCDIEEARDAMDRDLRALEELVRHETNPRVQVERHPLLVAGIVAGFVLAGFLVVKILRS